ncbi:hypothetical protein GCM10010260_80780 [Streptomyces filipinensis]|uniref:Uncharacterized protein n=1 Tax=Streptomyces filipinensis TaxID=66887 RepID=A0A918MFE0_9ACTN|nr:hypothetical protein GCM10010260_80780 [Streptomyces filipinensis]
MPVTGLNEDRRIGYSGGFGRRKFARLFYATRAGEQGQIFILLMVENLAWFTLKEVTDHIFGFTGRNP